MKVQMTKKDIIIWGLTILISLFTLNLLASRHFGRIDLTAGQEYTLAPATKDLISKLDDIITIRLYFTKKLPPALLPLKRLVDDVLDEYKSYAGDRLRIEYRNPTESPELEKEIQGMGIPPVHINIIEHDKRELAKIYLGLAVLYGDKKQIIPVVQSTDNLEYQITSAILKVTSKALPKIAWWGPPLEDPLRDPFAVIKQQLEMRYVLSIIDPERPELDNEKADLLILANPQGLTQPMQYMIDQFLMHGGKIIAMINTADITNNLQLAPVDSGLTELFKNYGATVEDKLALDLISAYAAFGSGYISYQVPYAYWPLIRKENLATENPIVSQLEAITFPWTSPIRLTTPTPDGLAITTLAKTTPDAAVQPLVGIDLTPDAAQVAMHTPAGAQPLAVLMTGKFKSFFADKPVPKEIRIAEPKNSTENGSIILIGNARMIQSNFLKQFADNLVFFENAADYLALGDQLIGIRSRAKTERPLVELSDVARASIKYANTFGAPLVLVAFGAVIFVLRHRRQRRIREMFKRNSADQ